MALTAGTKLGPYDIVALLGAGGMGEVYRARDTRLERDIAIKVLPATLYLHGRADYEKFHARLLSGRFKDSIFSPLEMTVRFLRHNMAVVHWSWKMSGDKNFDGTARPPRFGLMTLVVEKLADRCCAKHKCSTRNASRAPGHQGSNRDTWNGSQAVSC